MSMSLESTPVAWEARESSSRNSILPLLRACLLAYTSAMGQAEGYTPPVQPVQKEKTAQHTENMENMKPLDHLKCALQTHSHLLDHEDSDKRESAQTTIKNAIENALKQRNPLPPDVHESMIVPKRTNKMMEKFAQMRHLREFTRTQEQLLPGRIAAPDVRTPLVTILEKQFGCTITVEDPSCDDTLRNYRIGSDGEMGGMALERLCRGMNCIPHITKGGFILQKKKEGDDFRANGLLGIVRHDRNIEVFLLPDKGVILTTETNFEEGYYTEESEVQEQTTQNLDPYDPGQPWVGDISNAMHTPWSKYMGQCTPVPKISFTMAGQSLQAIVATSPTTVELNIDSKESTKLGPQYLRIVDSTQQEDGSWVTNFRGTVWEEIPWPETTNTEDMYSYQLVACNTINVISKDNTITSATTSLLHFNERLLTFRVETLEKPERFHVKGFTEIQLQKMHLP